MKIFYLPDLGEGLAEAEIREWYVKPGEHVEVDQPLVSMETAKAIVDVPSPYKGKIVTLHGAVNDVIKTGAPFITFDTGEMTHNQASIKGSVVGALEESSEKWQEEAPIQPRKTTTTTSIKAMPAARILAKEMQIDLTGVTPTGPQGLITVEDVKKQLVASKTSGMTNLTLDQAEPLRGLRRSMAATMAESHRTIVPVTIHDDANLTELSGKIDMTVHLLKAIVFAAKAEPALNAWFNGDALERQLFDAVHVGLAIDTPEGLLVPVMQHVEKKSAEELRNTINTYKEEAKARRLTSNSMQGATITLSNFGTVAGRYGTPIVVPPAVAILASGRICEVPVIKHGQVVVGRVLPLSLSFDHRAITGAEATRFLNAVITYLQKNPS